MNVTEIHLYSTLDGLLTPVEHVRFAIKSPQYTDSYVVKGLDGLDADSLVSSSYNSTGIIKYGYSSQKQQSRLVKILLGLTPQYSEGETVESLRDALLRLIAYTRNGQLEIRFMDGSTHVASLYGSISKFESSIYTNDPQVQLSFDCDDAILRAQSYVNIPSPTVPSPSWTDDLSTAPHGYVMSLAFTGTVTSPLIINGVYGTDVANFQINESFALGDVLHISSEYGNLYVTKFNGVTNIGLADKIEPGSVWPEIFPGTTHINVNTSNFTWSELKHRPAYWGI